MSEILDYCNRCQSTHNAGCWRAELGELRDRLTALERAREPAAKAWKTSVICADCGSTLFYSDKGLHCPNRVNESGLCPPQAPPTPEPEEKWLAPARAYLDARGRWYDERDLRQMAELIQSVDGNARAEAREKALREAEVVALNGCDRNPPTHPRTPYCDGHRAAASAIAALRRKP